MTTITVNLLPGLFGAELRVEDISGEKKLLLSPCGTEYTQTKLEINGDFFDLTVLPFCTASGKQSAPRITNTWKDRLIRTAVGGISSIAEALPFRASCKYRISGMKDGDILTLSIRFYSFAQKKKFDPIELLLMEYCFPYVELSNGSCELIEATEQNREVYLPAARALALVGFHPIRFFLHPFRMGRIKHKTKNKQLFKTLRAFYRLSPAERVKRLSDRLESQLEHTAFETPTKVINIALGLIPTDRINGVASALTERIKNTVLPPKSKD